MFTRLNNTIINAINKVLDESVCDFSKWWADDFETDYGFDTEEELRAFPKDDLDCVKCDWIAWVSDGFTYQAMCELGIKDAVKTQSHTILIEELYEIIKEELLKRIETEWK